MSNDELPRWKRELPATPHKLLNDLVTLLVNFYLEHLERDTKAGRLAPSEPWQLLRGFLLAAMQSYASICVLLAEKRPKRLMLQAAVLNRALFEILGTTFGLLEEPGSRARALLREAHKANVTHYQFLLSRWGSTPHWQEYLDVFKTGLITMGTGLGLSRDDALNPNAISEEWPTPGVMIYGRPSRGTPPFISGARREVLKEIYQFHYPQLSAQAHGRIAAMAVAALVDKPENQWNPGYGESHIALTAILFLTCLLSELQNAGEFRKHPKLAELWAYLNDMDEEAKELWKLRYEEIVKIVGESTAQGIK